jgi:thiamine biosynthesis lipoprotein
MNACCARVNRARPLLGTLVEIVLRGESEPTLHAAAANAFDAMERVHRLMSSHSETSDVTRLNRQASRRTIAVDEQTWSVLDLARKVSAATDGVFDVTVGGRMMQQGMLPRLAEGPFDAEASFEHIELMGGSRVRFHRALAIDLGGIAKGYAVDRAVEVLGKWPGVTGWVNAGGDLRSFGADPVPVRVRDPYRPSQTAALAMVRNGAFATTARYSLDSGLSTAGTLLDPRSSARPRGIRSASVRAASCAVADALAKSVFLLERRAASILPKFAASGFLIGRHGPEMIGMQS